MWCRRYRGRVSIIWRRTKRIKKPRARWIRNYWLGLVAVDIWMSVENVEPLASRVCDTWLETDNEGVGGWAALLGPGLGLMLVLTLAAPVYLARMAWRFARRAARMSSTGGGEGGKSSSISTTVDSVIMVWALERGCTGSFASESGEWLRGEILEDEKITVRYRNLVELFWSYDTYSPSSFSSSTRCDDECDPAGSSRRRSVLPRSRSSLGYLS